MRLGLSRSQTSVNGDCRILEPTECALICSGLFIRPDDSIPSKENRLYRGLQCRLYSGSLFCVSER